MSTSRRTFLMGGPAAALASSAPRKRPNILWISCEDTGPELGCYGDPNAITPTLDKLAAQGVRYERAYTVAGVCAPSRSGIITGMFPTTLGSHHMRCQATLPPHVRCFPAFLRDAGYYTSNNSKTDYNFPVPKDAWNESSGKAHWRNRAKGQPFFSVFNITTTHESRLTFRGEAYEKETARLKPGERRDPAKLRIPPYHPDTPECRRDWANYYDCVTAMDYQAADILRQLEEDGLLEETIVFFWGDHGVGLPRSKRWLYESSTHVPLIARIPQALRTGPQGRPGSVSRELVSFLDLGPTALNLAGVPLPGQFQGRAFLGPALTPPRQYIYGARDRMDERYDMVRMVRDAKYRYIRNYEPHKPWYQHMRTPEQGATMRDIRRLEREGKLGETAARYCRAPKPAEELYDVDADPHEIHNLAEQAAHQSVLRRLRGAHEAWAMETRDLGLVPEPEIAARERAAGSRYAILREAGAERLMLRLREVNALLPKADASRARLLEALGDPDAAVRYWAVTALATVPSAVATNQERLVRLCGDPSATVRVAAARALALHTTDPIAVPLLAKELRGEEEYVRLHAIHALDDLGAKAAPARAAAEAALKDSNNYVGRVAEHVLATLQAG